MKGQTGATGVMGPPGPPGPNGHPGPPGPPASGAVARKHNTARRNQPQVITQCRTGHMWVIELISVNFLCLTGLYLVGEKGEKGLPGPPGRCNCDVAPGPNNAPFGSYTQRSGTNKVTAVRPHPVPILSFKIEINLLSLIYVCVCVFV